MRWDEAISIPHELQIFVDDVVNSVDPKYLAGDEMDITRDNDYVKVSFCTDMLFL